MAVQIQFRRGTAQEWSGVNPVLAEAEMGIETDTNLFKIGNGFDPWDDLPYGGLRGYSGSTGVTGSVGNIAVENVLYVSKSGDDANDGRSLNSTKLTIKSALLIAKTGTTIFVKSGDYTEDNPMLVPEGVAVVGDSLRTVTVRPLNLTQDLFWLNNGVYLQQMTFKDMESPAAAVAFPTDGSAGAIHTSPYVQNCTTMTTTGTGMRVDGNHVSGLKSMVVDAFTQYNQGGIGIHMLNRGNTQLVSVFTICCDVGFLCESGGFCSITNSNSSFGNYALKADGVSPPLYTAKVKGTASGDTFTLDGLITRPNIGDAVKFGDVIDYYTVATASTFTPGSAVIAYPNYNTESASLRNARSIVLDVKSKIQIDMIDYINETYPSFSYNQFKTTRDAGYVIDAVIDDMVFGTNYKSVLAGTAYSRLSATYNITEQKTETVDALSFVKKKVLKILLENYTEASVEYIRISQNFDTVINALLNNTGTSFQTAVPQISGTAGSAAASNDAVELTNIVIDVVVNKGLAPEVVYPTYPWVPANLQEAFSILQNAKSILKNEVTSWLTSNFPVLIYDQETCQRDVGIIIDAVGYDMMFGSNFKSAKAGMSYYRAQSSLVISSQKIATTQAFNYLKTQMTTLVSSDALAVVRIETNMDSIIDIITNGLSVVPSFIIPNPTGYPAGYSDARNLIVSNTAFFKAEVTKFISDNFPGFAYDQAKCARDTGIIIDGTYFDVALGTNYNAIVNGRSYRRAMAVEVINTQLEQTLGAINYTRILVDADLADNTTAAQRSDISFDVLVDIIANGESAVPAFNWSDTGIDQNKKFAREQLQINKTLIRADLITWINTTYPGLVYDQTICSRDVGYIIDAISYDIQFGGNTATRVAAEAYFEGAVSVLPALQKAATAAAFVQLSLIVTDVVQELYPSQNVSGNSATITEVNELQALIAIVSDVITADSVSALPAAVNPTTVWVDNDIQLAIASLVVNKVVIVDATIAYINDTYGFVYDSAKCQRDIGYLIDAVRYDLTYGGNTETLNSALSYYSGTQLQIPQKQRSATASAYRYLLSLVQKVSLNQTVGVAPTVVYVNPTAVSADISNASVNLQLNKAFIVAETIEYIADNFQSFVYNTVTCQRDIGIIVDAIAYDLIFGSNFKSIKAGQSYYRAQAATVVGAQKFATLKSFEYLKTLLLAEVSSNTLAVTRVTANMDIIINILTNGLGVVPGFDLSEPVGYDVNFKNARDNIVSNTVFIKAETIAFIAATYPGLVYDSALCQRDIGYIIDAVNYDLTYGGNSETVTAGLAYYTGTTLVTPAGERAATVAAYNFLASLVLDIAQDNTVSALQAVVNQQPGSTSSIAAASAAEGLIIIVKNIVDDIATAPTKIFPGVAWVPPALLTLFNTLQTNNTAIQIAVTTWIDANFVNFTYNTTACSRDVELIINAVTYDLLYQGNSQTADAADEYYSGGVLQIPGETLQTVQTYGYVKVLVEQIVVNTAITPLQVVVAQNTTTPAATATESTTVGALVNIVSNIVENAYTSIITLEESSPEVLDNTNVTFHQYSLITAAGHTFEWIGAGTNVNTALPYLGGTPLTENQVVENNGGKVYFTGTDQRGDFRIGNGLVINRNTGTISGRTFTKSLFAVMTPYILAIGE